MKIVGSTPLNCLNKISLETEFLVGLSLGRIFYSERQQPYLLIGMTKWAYEEGEDISRQRQLIIITGGIDFVIDKKDI